MQILKVVAVIGIYVCVLVAGICVARFMDRRRH
jgi:hypothetical protein